MPFLRERSKSRDRSFVGENNMQGVITSRDVLKHLPLIWREFGTRCAMKALSAVLTGKKTTFLDVACGAERPVETEGSPSKKTYRN